MEPAERFATLCAELFTDVDSIEAQTALINECRRVLHEYSPFRNEPVDFVQWVPTGRIFAND